MNLQETLKMIKNPNELAMNESLTRWNSIAKPLHSLGKLEDAVVKLAGIFETNDVCIDKKAHVVMCADNGVIEEGVSQSGSEVTAIVANNFLEVKSSVSIMCRKLGVDLYPIDVGMCTDTNIISKKIAYGTKNMAKYPAMTRDEAVQAIEVGINIVKELKDKGYQIIGTGEMGIGNTTTSSAITSVLLNVSVEEVTGKGAGLSSEGLTRKVDVIKKAINLHKPDANDPIDILSKVGGFDIAGLVGVFLGGAALNIPIVIDGFISSVAALLAVKLNPLSIHYMFASHISYEPACMILLQTLGLEAFLTCDMHLGEGTGAVALFPILDLAIEIYNQMSTFEQINMDAYEELK